MSMLRVTFYSYKGGVGRTLSMLNVAAILASNGRKVVVVDMDLEAPVLGLFKATKASKTKSTKSQNPGVSDFILDRRQGGNASIEDYSYCLKKSVYGDRLRVIPVGSSDRVAKLVTHLPEFYKDPASDAADLFQLLISEIEDEFAPEYLLIDSPAGLSEISGICTVELAQILVAVCGLNDNNIYGMKSALDLIYRHPARQSELATILAISQIPRAVDMGDGIPQIDQYLTDTNYVPNEQRFASHPILNKIYRAHVELLSPNTFLETRRVFPGLQKKDLVHHIFYDPLSALCDEFAIEQFNTGLFESYYRIAQSLSRAHPKDFALVYKDVEHTPKIPILNSNWIE